MTVGIIGGTGPQGQGLAMRFAVAGVPIFIGSREKNKSEEIVAEINKKIPSGSALIEGGTNQEAINRSTEIIIFAVPWEAHNYLLNDLKDHSHSYFLYSVHSLIKYDSYLILMVICLYLLY